MREKLLIFILFLLLTFPAYQGLLTTQIITNDDLGSHVTRLIEFDQALSDGNFPVRWFKRINFGLGYPFMIFNYPLVYYIAEIFLKVGFSPSGSMMFLLLLSFPLSGFFAYLWLKNHFGKTAAILGGLTYTLIPYHFVNVYIRGAMGEVMAITAVPLGFYFIDRLIKKPSLLNSALTAVSIALIILLHNVVALYFIPIFCLYFLIQFFEKRSLRLIAIFFLSGVWGFAVSAFYLIPLYLYKPLVQLNGLKEDFLGNVTFSTIYDLIYMKWGFGGPKLNFGQGEMSLQLGILAQVFLISALFILVRNFKKRSPAFHLAWLWISLFLFSCFMMLEVSFPVWKIFEVFQYQEFPWRFLSITSASAAFFAAFSFRYFEKKFTSKIPAVLALLLIAGLLFTSRNYGRPEAYIEFKDPFPDNQVMQGTGTYRGEHLPIWHSKTEEIFPYYGGKVIRGNAQISSVIWKTNLHLFEINALEDSLIADRTDYFPGWEVYANGTKIKTLDPRSPEASGLTAFYLPKGQYKVEVKLNKTLAEQIADYITLSSLLLIPLLIFLPNRRFLSFKNPKK